MRHAPGAGTRAIEAVTLTKDYGDVLALRQVSLVADYGTIGCLLGPNGAGKTTLIRILVGHATTSSGMVRLHLVGRSATLDAQVGYIPDVSMVYPLLTVREHLRFVEAAYRLGRLSKQDENRFMAAFGLDEHADFLAGKLSKGLKKRLMLACAVRHDAQIFILDEPFDGLDPAGQQLLMSLVFQLRDAGKCVFISTHRLDVAERISDRLFVVDHGELVFAGTPREFTGLVPEDLTAAQTRFERAFTAVTTVRKSNPGLSDLGVI